MVLLRAASLCFVVLLGCATAPQPEQAPEDTGFPSLPTPLLGPVYNPTHTGPHWSPATPPDPAEWVGDAQRRHRRRIPPAQSQIQTASQEPEDIVDSVSLPPEEPEDIFAGVPSPPEEPEDIFAGVPSPPWAATSNSTQADGGAEGAAAATANSAQSEGGAEGAAAATAALTQADGGATRAAAATAASTQAAVGAEGGAAATADSTPRSLTQEDIHTDINEVMNLLATAANPATDRPPMLISLRINSLNVHMSSSSTRTASAQTQTSSQLWCRTRTTTLWHWNC